MNYAFKMMAVVLALGLLVSQGCTATKNCVPLSKDEATKFFYGQKLTTKQRSEFIDRIKHEDGKMFLCDY